MPTMTLRDFAAHLARTAYQMPQRQRQALDSSGHRVRDLARSYIGEYQQAEGPFPAWAPLAQFTVEDRLAKGYSPDEPLLREGTLRASIKYAVVGGRLDVFSTHKIAGYQEFGTTSHNRIPPRAFIGRAMAARGRVEALYVARAVLRPLLTGRP